MISREARLKASHRKRGGRWYAYAWAALAAVPFIAARPNTARACSPPPPAPLTAIPRMDTANVSTMTTIIVGASTEPTGLTLLANGTAVGPLSFRALGSGLDGARTTFWKVRIGGPGIDQPLEPNTEYVLSSSGTNPPLGPDGGAGGPDGGGGPTTVTRFTTAAGYDKALGTPPVLNDLKLWRVRYPVKDIASGNCVFDEYHGFLTVDYQPATIPNTPANAVVHTLSLTPRHGSSNQTFVFAGATPFRGAAPAGDYPTPIWAWHPELDPTREYCMTISAFGDGDRARLPVTSNTLCVPVVQLSASGAPPPPTTGDSPTPDAGAGAARAGGGGCVVAGDRAPSSAGSAFLAAVGACLAGLFVRRRRNRAGSSASVRPLR